MFSVPFSFAAGELAAYQYRSSQLESEVRGARPPLVLPAQPASETNRVATVAARRERWVVEREPLLIDGKVVGTCGPCLRRWRSGRSSRPGLPTGSSLAEARSPRRSNGLHESCPAHRSTSRRDQGHRPPTRRTTTGDSLSMRFGTACSVGLGCGQSEAPHWSTIVGVGNTGQSLLFPRAPTHPSVPPCHS